MSEEKNHKSVFIGPLVLTILILALGLFLGVFIEMMRTNGVAESYKAYEVEALDLKLQNYYYQIMDSSECTQAIQQNFDFTDSLYAEGLKIDKYESANQLTDDIILEKKRYVLLKTEAWLNSILLKKKCGNKFDTIVYMYAHQPGSNAVKSEQELISNVLKGIKEKQGDKLLLIPIAGNMGIQTIELQKRIYNITELPSILINEKTVFTGFKSEEEILKELSVK